MMRRGFSLVELSIVLVILGLLVGGILAGQSLVRASELRALGTEYDRYNTAINAFRDKYFARPGDMTNATKFWGVSTVCTGGSATGTCDGNGDGLIGWSAGAGITGESFQFWRHLALSGLMEGNFSGVAAAGSGAAMINGTNIPASKFKGGGWSVFYSGPMNDANWYNLDWGNNLAFGGDITASWNYSALLTIVDLWNFDVKMDDGKPGMGKIMANSWSNCTLAASSSDYGAEYRLSANPATRCILVGPKYI